MKIKSINETLYVSDAITVDNIPVLAELGVKTIICNRHDGETPEQVAYDDIAKRAIAMGMDVHYVPVTAGQYRQGAVSKVDNIIASSSGAVLAYCRTGNRSTTLWALNQLQQGHDSDALISHAKSLGYDVSEALRQDIFQNTLSRPDLSFDIVVVGAGAAGVAAASSIVSRTHKFSIAIIDPASKHYYQPGWTMVGAGVFNAKDTERSIERVIPSGASFLNHAVVDFTPDHSSLTMSDGREVGYGQLVIAAGLKLDWEQINGLSETLGKNGVTSNYRYDLAPYTWELAKKLKKGRAIFTQPPMPIKCAGAPQKAMYLSADNWFKKGCLDNIHIDFYTAGAALFGVAHYVPSLMEYIDKYNIDLHFTHNLVRVDGEKKQAWFETQNATGEVSSHVESFDMLHVCPPQTAPDFIKNSALADPVGWVDVDEKSLQHVKYSNIWGLGDVTNTPNAKTAAAARAQAPVLASNLLATLGFATPLLSYQGYGSCPLTVEVGKVVLAEFGYGGKLMPTFPSWLINGAKPSSLSWALKKNVLPELYWHGMLKGREWMVDTQEKSKLD